MSAEDKEPYFDGPHMSSSGHLPPPNMQDNEMQHHYNLLIPNQQSLSLNEDQDDQFPPLSAYENSDIQLTHSSNSNNMENYQPDSLEQQEHKINSFQIQPQDYETSSSSENSLWTDQQSFSQNISLTTSSHQVIQPDELASQTRTFPNTDSLEDWASSSNILSSASNFSNVTAQYMDPAEHNSHDQDQTYDLTLVQLGSHGVMPENIGQNYSFGSYMNMENYNSAQLHNERNCGQLPDDVGCIDASSSHLHPTNERREYDGLHSQGTWMPVSRTLASTSDWKLVENIKYQPMGDPVMGEINNHRCEMLSHEHDVLPLQHSESFEVLNDVVPKMEKLNISPDVNLEPADDISITKNYPVESNTEYPSQIGSNELNFPQQSFEASQYDFGNCVPEFSKENIETSLSGSSLQPEVSRNQSVLQEIQTIEKSIEPIKNSGEKKSHSCGNSFSSLEDRRNSNSSTGSRRSCCSHQSGPPVVVAAGNLPANMQHPENENIIDTQTMHSSYVTVEPKSVDNSDSLKANTSYHQPSYCIPSNNNLHSQMAVSSAPSTRLVPMASSNSEYNQSYSDMHSGLHPYTDYDDSTSVSAPISVLKLSLEQEVVQPPSTLAVVATAAANGFQQNVCIDQRTSCTNNNHAFVKTTVSSSGNKLPPTSESVSGNIEQQLEKEQTNHFLTNYPDLSIQQLTDFTSQLPVSNSLVNPEKQSQHHADESATCPGFEQNPQHPKYSQSNIYVTNKPIEKFPENIPYESGLSAVQPHHQNKNPPLSNYQSNQEPGYISQTNPVHLPLRNQQVTDRNYHQAPNMRDNHEPIINHRHPVLSNTSHHAPSFNDGHYKIQSFESSQPHDYPPIASNVNVPSHSHMPRSHGESTSHHPSSGYGAQYYQNNSYQQTDVERVSSRPPSRSSITGESTYIPYHERSNDDQYNNNYNRPRSRQGYDYDQRYSGRYNNEYDDYYRTRNQDNYNTSYRRDYYEGRSDYHKINAGYYDPRYGYNRRTSESYGRYHQDQYYNQQLGYKDWRSQHYDSLYYANRGRSKVESYGVSNVQDQSSYSMNNFNESVQQGYQYKEDHTLEDGASYCNTYDEETWENLPQVPSRRTPVKFNSVHPLLRFSAGGFLIRVLPNSPVDGKPAAVEVLSVETLLEESPEAEEFRSYPGPLSRKETHKIDVVGFTTRLSSQIKRRTDLVDRTSVSLTWDFLSVLVRQNGTIMGTDVAELLMHDHSGNFGLMQSPNDIQRRPQQITCSINTDEPPQNDETNVNSEDKATTWFRDLLLYGRKKDALEWAMKSNLWGHALLLASKTDARTHANVMLRFANSLPMNDPLQTLYQLMSGRQPAATTCITEEGWGNWRPHLAMMLSNSTESISLDTKAVITLGDTLLAKGLLDAAHFCYLMATSPLSYYSKKSGKLVLIGSDHSLPFFVFATNEGIQKSECYEYALALGHATNKTKMEFMPALQIYKLIYAARLLEFGIVEKSFHYCENIAKVVCKSPSLYSVTLVSQLIELINVMQYHDPRVQAGGELSSDLRWIQSLLSIRMRMGSSLGSGAPSFTISPSLNSSASSQHDSSSSGEEEDKTEIVKMLSSQAIGQNIDQHSGQMQPIKNAQLAGHKLNSSAPSHFAESTFYVPPQSEELMQKSNPLLQQQFENQPHIPSQNNHSPPLFQPNQQSIQPPQFYPYHQTEYQASQIPQHPPLQTQSTNANNNQYPPMPSHEVVSRVRTVSQTSHASHRSHKSTGRRSRTTSENSHQSRSRSTSAESIKNEKATEKEKKGWGIMNWFSRKKVNQVHLPDDTVKELVWDPVKKRWANGEDEEEEEITPPPPMVAAQSSPSDAPIPSGQMTKNKFSLKSLNNRSMYKDAFGGDSLASTSQNIAPPLIFPAAHTHQNNTSVFIPKPVPVNGPLGSVNEVNQKMTENEIPEQIEKQKPQEQNNFQQQPPMFHAQKINQHPFQSQINNQSFQQHQFQPPNNFQQQKFQTDIQQQPEFLPSNTINNPQPGPNHLQITSNNSEPQPPPPVAPLTTFYNPSQFGESQSGSPFSQPTGRGFSGRSRSGRGRGYPKISGN